MILTRACRRVEELSLRSRVAIITLALLPVLFVAKNARAAETYCYWTCYGYAQYCNPTDKAHVCCTGEGCTVISCVSGLCS